MQGLVLQTFEHAKHKTSLDIGVFASSPSCPLVAKIILQRILGETFTGSSSLCLFKMNLAMSTKEWTVEI